MSNEFDSWSFPGRMVCLQMDDIAYVSNTDFRNIEKNRRKQFDSKDTVALSNGKMCKFNGRNLHFYSAKYTITEPNHIENITLLNQPSFTADDFVSKRSEGAYGSAVCRAGASCAFSNASQITKLDEKT